MAAGSKKKKGALMGLAKMKIIGFRIIQSDGQKPVRKHAGNFDVQVNPASIKITRKINYGNTRAMGKSKNKKFDAFDADTLNFEILLDATGILPESKQSVKERVGQLESVLYDMNSEAHEPNYMKIVWGSFTFFGRLASLNYNYTLFKPDGAPLRVKISLSFNGSGEDKEVKSPDLSRVHILKEGETLPFLCEEYYNDPSYCFEVAKVNNLATFRYVKPGTRLLFPSLIRYGGIFE